MGYAARPSSAFGYWRGVGGDGPFYLGQGSYTYGPSRQGAGVFPPGSGSAGQGPGWTPTLTYLLILVVAELVLVKCLERMLR
jgi:hypothetical protein